MGDSDSAVSEYPSRVGAPHASVLGALRADLARDGPLARELLDDCAAVIWASTSAF